MIDGPSVQNDIWRYYESRSPGQLMVLGPDLFNGTPAQLVAVGNTIGATFPLLVNGALGVGVENLFATYGDRDNYAVINKQGVVRYQAFDRYLYGNRYHLSELRGCIDSLLTVTVGVDDAPAPGGFALRSSPNPARGPIELTLASPSDRSLRATVGVYDVAGREVAVLWNGPVTQGSTRMTWTGRRADGTACAPGLYLVRARVGDTSLALRVLRLD